VTRRAQRTEEAERQAAPVDGQLDLFGRIGEGMGAVERWADSQGYSVVVGVDEAGRGPLAGPVVVGAVILDVERAAREGWLYRLADSKVLRPQQREELFEHIRCGARRAAVAQAEPRDIDRLNILGATHWAMGQAVKEVLGDLAAESFIVAVDGNQPIPGVGPQRAVVKGDARSYAIAAASILAKVCRDRILVRYERHWPGYGFARHKGYPTRRHRQCVIDLGPCPIHRRTFRVTPPDGSREER
jgi:ribonuclease HII